jgi:glycosyltransferase involved in cell wall biosynthesis
MRIAHLVSTFPPYRGGIGNIAFHFARELTLLGDQNEVFTPDYDGKEKGGVMDGFKVHRLLPWIKYGNAAMVPQLLWKLSDFDLVHIHYPFFGGVEWPFLMKSVFVRTPKIVLSYHMDVIGNGILKPFFRLYGKTVLPLLIRYSDALIVSTRDYAETSLISPFLNRKPVYEIPYGVTSRFHPMEKNQKLIARLNLITQNRIILFVGGLDRAHYFKGVPNLISAIRRLNDIDVRLLLIGNGDRIPLYRDQVQKEGLQDQVQFVSGVPDEELPDYYNLADLVVLPSINRSEAFGIVLLEAMACGRPVVASSLPGVRAIINERQNGLLVVPGNLGDLTEKLRFMLDRPGLREEYGLNGFKKVEEGYRWNQVVQKVRKVYLDLLESPEKGQKVSE